MVQASRFLTPNANDNQSTIPTELSETELFRTTGLLFIGILGCVFIPACLAFAFQGEEWWDRVNNLHPKQSLLESTDALFAVFATEASMICTRAAKVGVAPFRAAVPTFAGVCLMLALVPCACSLWWLGGTNDISFFSFYTERLAAMVMANQLLQCASLNVIFTAFLKCESLIMLQQQFLDSQLYSTQRQFNSLTNLEWTRGIVFKPIQSKSCHQQQSWCGINNSIQIIQLYGLGLELILDLVSLIFFLMHEQKRWSDLSNVSFQVDRSNKSAWNNSTIISLVNLCLIAVVM